jgi:septation ring formation regulator EzrA
MPQDYVIFVMSAAIAMFGWMIRQSVERVDTRLKSLEDKIVLIATQVAVAVSRQENNSVEIDKLRARMAVIESTLATVASIQDHCKSCMGGD